MIGDDHEQTERSGGQPDAPDDATGIAAGARLADAQREANGLMARMASERESQRHMEQQQMMLGLRQHAVGAAMATFGGPVDDAQFDVLLQRAGRIAGFFVSGADPAAVDKRRAVQSVTEMLERIEGRDGDDSGAGGQWA